MVNYFDIISISNFIMIFNILCSKWVINKSMKNTFILLNIFFILFHKILILINNDFIFKYIIINKILIIIYIVFNNIDKNKKLYLFLMVNYIICFFSTIFNFDKIVYDLISIYLFMSTLYVFSISNYIHKMNISYRILIYTYFVCISFILIFRDYYNHILNIFNFIDLMSSFIILFNVFKYNVMETNNKNIQLKNNLQFSNIQLEKYSERIFMNKYILSKLEFIINRKNELVEKIYQKMNKCIIIIDDFDEIVSKDKHFYDMWPKYKSCNIVFNLQQFLDSNIKDKDKFLNSIKNTRLWGKQTEVEVQDDSDRYFLVRFSKISLGRNDNAIMCCIEDITYKKDAQRKIEENDIKYKKIVDNIPCSILIVENGNIIYNNKKDKNINFEIIKNEILKPYENMEIEYKGLDDKFYFYTKKASFKSKSNENEVISIKDITEYKKAFNLLKNSKEKYKTLVNLIPEGIYTLDFENNNISYVNSSMLSIFSSENIEDIDLSQVNENIVFGNSNDYRNIKFKRSTILNKKGEEIHIESGGMFIEVEKKLKVVGIIRDITEQVKSEIIELEIEKKKAENKVKSEFFVNISHELKTPLNVISSSNQLLEILHKDMINNEPNGDIATTCNTVKKYCNIVMGLVDTIMDLAKLQLNISEHNSKKYNAVEIIEGLVNEFNNYTKSSDISIIFDTDEEEKIINIDIQYIKKAIIILLTLIIRYSDLKSEIYVVLSKNKDDNLSINIKNDGNYDYSKYINDKERRSLDIGLNIVEQIIKIYDGKIQINMCASKTIEIDIELKVENECMHYEIAKNIQNGNEIYYRCMGLCN